jgi:flagellin
LNATAETNTLGRARVRAYLSEGTRGNLVIEAVGSKAAGATQPTFSVAQTTLAAGAGSASQSLKEVFSLTGAANTAPAESGSLTVVGGQLSIAGGETQASRTTLANNYKNMLSQIEQLARDAGYNGINLLQTDALRISFNENDTTALRVSNSFTDRGSLSLTGETVAAGLQAISSRGFTDTVSGNFQSDAEIKNAKKNIDNAIKSMANLGASFAQNQTIVQVREDFTANQVKTLDAGGDALVVADINEEGAKLLALQTRQQLSVQALSLAGQSEQAVLRLF